MLSSVLKKAGATNIVPIKNQREYRRAQGFDDGQSGTLATFPRGYSITMHGPCGNRSEQLLRAELR